MVEDLWNVHFSNWNPTCDNPWWNCIDWDVA